MGDDHPLLVMFVTIFVMFIGWGFPGQNIPGSKIRIALTSGYMLATIVLAIMVIVKKIMTSTEVVDTWVSGIKKMAGILAIIIAAWGVGSVCTALGTSQFVVDCTIGFLSPALVPALLFIIGAVISFATGTRRGAPWLSLRRCGINIAYGFGVSEAITIAAVLSGSLFGDHCAPISDTTVMSSMAGGCNHIDHVRTQIPYALLAAVASFIASSHRGCDPDGGGASPCTGGVGVPGGASRSCWKLRPGCSARELRKRGGATVRE
ncbi:MAG: Na+/H+ antiporter NhaC family protein [Dysosmobacter sp.]